MSVPAWFEEARARMRDERKLGLVVRIPADREKRHELGHWVEDLVNKPDDGLLKTVVPLCLDDEAFREALPGIRADARLLLIDAEGAFVGGGDLRKLQKLIRERAGRPRLKETLPYGIEFGRASACGDSCREQTEELAIRCGMARVGPGYRAFIQFLNA